MRSISSLFPHCQRSRATVAGAVLMALLLAAMLTACGGTSSATTKSDGVTVNVKVAHGQDGSTLVLLPVTINGQGPFTFALDTGASTSLIDTPLAQQLGLPQHGAPTPIAGVSGKEQSVPVLVNSWSIEKIKLPKMTVQSANLFAAQRGSGLKGLIGSDIWNRFGKFTLNYNAGQLTVPKQIVGLSQRAPIAVYTAPSQEALVPSQSRLSPAA